MSRSVGCFKVFHARWVLLFVLAAFTMAASASAQNAPAPIKALLILGGCCHDYAGQKDVLKSGIESRANVTVDAVYSPDTSTAPPLAILGDPNYAPLEPLGQARGGSPLEP